MNEILGLKLCSFCGQQTTIAMHPGNNWDGKYGDSGSASVRASALIPIEEVCKS